MPDLLTHVLVGYILATALSVRYDWLTPEFVTVVMLGALVPDLSKIAIVVPGPRVEALIGIPFEWFAIHMLGGTLVAISIGALLTTTEHRRRVFMLLALGAASHLLLDALLLKASGHSFAIFWPLTTYQPPTPGLYASFDRWPAVVALLLAGSVWLLRSRQR
jgi:hypothetical protein